jgi:hypothetical protein
MGHTQTARMIHKLGGCKGSEEHVGRLLNHQVDAALSSLDVQEFLYFLNNLKAVFIWHLEVEDQQVDWLVNFS